MRGLGRRLDLLEGKASGQGPFALERLTDAELTRLEPLLADIEAAGDSEAVAKLSVDDRRFLDGILEKVKR